MDKWRVFGVGVVVAACCVSLAACDGDAGPVVTEPPPGTVTGTASPGSTPVVTATPTATPPATAWLLEQLPADALTDDVEGATATAEFFVELLGRIFADADLRAWKALSTDECNYCLSQIANVDDMVSGGYGARGGRVAIESSDTRVVSGTDGYTYVEVVASIEDLFLRHPDGVEELAEPASTTTFGLQMTFVDGVWRVNGVSLD